MKKIFKYISIWLAVRFSSLRPKLLTENEQLKMAVIELRNHFRFFGHDTSEWSDQELIEGIQKAGQKLAGVGLTKKELEEARKRMLRY